MPSILEDKTILSTDWFSLHAKMVDAETDPYFSVKTLDYVAVVAITSDKKHLILVRQYRPAVEKTTLELPSGHVEEGEMPEAAALRELQEETGFIAGKLEFTGCILTDTGRLDNHLWCFLATGCTAPADIVLQTRQPLEIEEGVEMILIPVEELYHCIETQEFDHALHIAAVMMAVLRYPDLIPHSIAPTRKPG